MENLIIYESFDEDGEENKDYLKAFIAGISFRKIFNKAFSDVSMDADIVEEPLSETEFIVECWPKSFDGAVSNRISYQIDDIAEELGKTFADKGITWRFSPGGGVSRIIFELSEPVNKKIANFMDLLM